MDKINKNRIKYMKRFIKLFNVPDLDKEMKALSEIKEYGNAFADMANVITGKIYAFILKDVKTYKDVKNVADKISGCESVKYSVMAFDIFSKLRNIAKMEITL